MSTSPIVNRAATRLQEARRYTGKVFRWQAWRKPSSDWDHDHCLVCWSRFAEPDDGWTDPVLHFEGWLTVWKVPAEPGRDFLDEMEEAGYKVARSPKTNNYMRGWFCPECFTLYRDELGFIVDPAHEQWQAAGL